MDNEENTVSNGQSKKIHGLVAYPESGKYVYKSPLAAGGILCQPTQLVYEDFFYFRQLWPIKTHHKHIEQLRKKKKKN